MPESPNVYLSDIFKFVQGFGQKGHQIGRKIGDALELITMGMVYRSGELQNFLVVENGVEGATGAEHKVEFGFYKTNALGRPEPIPTKLFGIIECKKVGVEQTVQNGFKKWASKEKRKFHETEGYSFYQRPTEGDARQIVVKGAEGDCNLEVTVDCAGRRNQYPLLVAKGDKIILASDIDSNFHVLPPGTSLRTIPRSLQKCLIITVEEIENQKVSKILIEDCLPGPQTPEKAKQASFVSLDVRKKTLGTFDKQPGNNSFISVLVIGEAAHWEGKSRSMVRLCNDYNLVVPDNVIVDFFEKMLAKFGDDYQDKINKSNYTANAVIRSLVDDVINRFEGKVLRKLDEEVFVKFQLEKNSTNGEPEMGVVPI
jgi:hypothetical protein